MPLPSILYPPRADEPPPAAPDTLNDLNIDLLIASITAGKAAYDLKPFFTAPLQDEAAVTYRQQVARDLENEALLAKLKTFAEQAAAVHRYLEMSRQLDFVEHQRGWFLEAALLYCQAVRGLEKALGEATLHAQGLLSFQQHLTGYTKSAAFTGLCEEAQRVKDALSEIRYCVTLQGTRFKVERYHGGTDYGEEIARVFQKFRQTEAEDYTVDLQPASGMNHVEAKILEFVARLYPEPFAALRRFHEAHADFVAPLIARFEREIQFYIAYLDFIAEFRRRGMPFCYPAVSAADKTEEVRDGFDLALAAAILHREGARIVYNDFALHGRERVLVVTGPNQGGKTTFARMFGQLHYLAALGLPIPARRARLHLPDRILTHFERREDVQNLRSKLEDDLLRARSLISQATDRSLIILNEIFSSTTLQDALFLSQKLMAQILEKDALAVWVTFIDELASYGEQTVSMVAQVRADDTTVRTFKIVRQPANGLAYAISLARKHGLTTEQIEERLTR